MDSLELSPLQRLPTVRGDRDPNSDDGAPGPVQRVQELLCWAAWRDPVKFGKCATGIDGDFGPGTEGAVQAFQRNAGAKLIITDGRVDGPTWVELHKPMAALLDRRAPADADERLGDVVVAIGEEWLALRPCEFRAKGQGNMGPIVRALMTRPAQRGKAWGPEGDGFPWCAGAVSTLIALAAEAKGVDVPIPYSWSCPEMGAWALGHGRLVRGETVGAPGQPANPVKPGDVFLCKGSSPWFWPHTGIVGGALADGRFRTLEGNSDPAGGFNGICFLERTRAIAACDFITL